MSGPTETEEPQECLPGNGCCGPGAHARGCVHRERELIRESRTETEPRRIKIRLERVTDPETGDVFTRKVDIPTEPRRVWVVELQDFDDGSWFASDVTSGTEGSADDMKKESESCGWKARVRAYVPETETETEGGD